jgi:tRNA (guanine-N7-)-methyltransferase
MSSLKRNGKTRWKPSYLRRQGQMTKAQRRYYRELWPKYGVPLSYGLKSNPAAIFSQSGSLHLEIGFGKGETLLHRATAEPESNFLGIEVHKPAIASVLKKIEDLQLNNVALAQQDALLFLADHLEDAQIEEVWIFFPEPWNTQEAHRRIIRPQTLNMLEPHLADGAELFMATDIEDYAQSALKTLSSSGQWINKSLAGTFSTRPSWRQESKYERKGLEADRPSIDLCFTYQLQAD